MYKVHTALQRMSDKLHIDGYEGKDKKIERIEASKKVFFERDLHKLICENGMFIDSQLQQSLLEPSRKSPKS